MTVKRNGDKVVLKSGKVSCSCCEPGECCMYPSQALFDGLYTYEDLPDTVLGTGIFADNNVVMSRLNPPQPSIDSTGTSYYRGTSTLGLLVGIGLRDGDEWVGSEVANEGAGFGQCLISRFPASSPNGIGDQFADSYTISGGQLGSITVTRVSLCLWEGTDSCGNLATLIYLEDPFNGKLWFADVPNYLEPCVRFDVRQGEKIGFQNSPVGNYGNPPYIETVLSVS